MGTASGAARPVDVTVRSQCSRWHGGTRLKQMRKGVLFDIKILSVTYWYPVDKL